MIQRIKRNWFAGIVILANLVAVIFYPSIGMESLDYTGRTFLNFLFIMTPVFVCIGLMDVWVERETVIRIMGEHSGGKGVIWALLLGMVTAVPLYVLLPITGVLLKKGIRIANALLFLCSSVNIRVPLLLFEISSLGWRFMLARFCLNILVVFAIAFLVERLLNDADKKQIYDTANERDT